MSNLLLSLLLGLSPITIKAAQLTTNHSVDWSCQHIEGSSLCDSSAIKNNSDSISTKIEPAPNKTSGISVSRGTWVREQVTHVQESSPDVNVNGLVAERLIVVADQGEYSFQLAAPVMYVPKDNFGNAVALDFALTLDLYNVDRDSNSTGPPPNVETVAQNYSARVARGMTKALQNGVDSLKGKIQDVSNTNIDIVEQNISAIRNQMNYAMSMSVNSSLPFGATFQETQKVVHNPLGVRSYTSIDYDPEIYRKRIEKHVAHRDYQSLAKTIEEINYNEDKSIREQLSSTLNQYVTKDGLLIPENINGRVPTSPLSQRSFLTKKDSQTGQVIRRLGNEYQAAWGYSQGFQTVREPNRKMAYSFGLATLSSADQMFALGDTQEGLALSEASLVLLDIARGARDGVELAVLARIEGMETIYDLITEAALRVYDDPVEFFGVMEDLVMALPGVKDAVIEQAQEKWDELTSGDPYLTSKAVAEIVTDIAIDSATGGVGRAIRTIPGEVLKIRMAMGEVTERVARAGIETPDTIKMAIRVDSLAGANRVSVEGRIATMKQMAGRRDLNFTDEDILRMGRFHDHITEMLVDIRPTTFSGTISRGISKESRDLAGNPKLNSVDDAFKRSPGRLENDNRFTRRGRGGVYAAAGTPEEVADLISQETGLPANKLLIGSKEITSNRMLDLTNVDIQRALNLDYKGDLKSDVPNSAIFPKILGDIARNSNFDGIIFNSRHNPSIKNIFLFDNVR